MWRTAPFEKCLKKMRRSTQFKTMKCSGLSEGGAGNCKKPDECQSATLVYKAVPDLATIWDDYKAGLKIVASKKAVKGATSDELKYFVSVLASRGPGLAKYPSEFFVIVYAPKDMQPESGLGRGHFLMKVGTRAWQGLRRQARAATLQCTSGPLPAHQAPLLPTHPRARRSAGHSWICSEQFVHLRTTRDGMCIHARAGAPTEKPHMHAPPWPNRRARACRHAYTRAPPPSQPSEWALSAPLGPTM
jgi:hypothetical protein